MSEFHKGYSVGYDEGYKKAQSEQIETLLAEAVELVRPGLEAKAALHPAEQELLTFVRNLKYGTVTITVQHGLPERGEEVRAKVMFRKGGKE